MQSAQLVPTPLSDTGPAQIVAPAPAVVKTPTKILGKNRTQRTPNVHLLGFADFAELAQERLGQYDLPDTRTRLSASGLRRWLPQLELSESQYARLVGMSLDKSAQWNAHWPLLSWLGAVLEMKGGV